VVARRLSALLSRHEPVGPLFPGVPTFAEVDGVEVVEARIPSGDRPLPQSRSVQPEVHANLVATQLKPIPPPRVVIAPGARLISDSGAVVTSDGRLVLESLWDRSHWGHSFNPPPVSPPVTRVSGRHASLISLWSRNNYHHWMFEALPRLATLHASGVPYDGIIVPKDLKVFQRESLQLFGITDDLLVPFHGTHLQPDELVWAAPLSPFEQPTPYEIEWLRRMNRHPPSAATERLYLRRPGVRQIANEAAVLGLLDKHGFRSVDSGTMTVSEQIEIFSKARFIVGAHGAAFSNGVFSRKLTAIELFHDYHVNISTTAALVAAGHEHWSIMCPRVPAFKRRKNQDLRASVRDLRMSLRAVGIDA
jgi:Glycosyltransferase 61